MLIKVQTPAEHTTASDGRSKDTPLHEKQGIKSSQTDEEQDRSSEMSGVSVIVHNGSIRSVNSFMYEHAQMYQF